MRTGKSVKQGLLILAAGLLPVSRARSENYIWDDGGDDQNWSTGTNWYTIESGKNNQEPQADDVALLGSTDPNGVLCATVVVDRAGAACGDLYVGYNSGSRGEIHIQGGSLHAAQTLRIGYSGEGLAIQTGGTVSSDSYLFIGGSKNGPGRYEIHGGILNPLSLYPGYVGTGTLVQSGGTVIAGNATDSAKHLVRVGQGAGSSGLYELNDGLLRTYNLYVGENGTGHFIQNGGTNQMTAYLLVGYTGGTGVYDLVNGSLFYTYMYLGYMNAGASGIFNQSGGTNFPAVDIILGRNTGTKGEYSLTGGTLIFTAGAREITVGYEGAGTFRLGDSNTVGLLRQSAPGTARLTVRRTAAASGIVRGWGKAEITGALNNSGRVMADGFGTDRELDLASLSMGTNNIANNSSNGWFAVNQGRLKLPSVSLASNPGYWGEKDNQDLVNSVKFDLAGASGSLSGSLLAADSSMVSNGLSKGLAVWQFGVDGGSPGTGTLTFRYDNTAAAGLKVPEDSLCIFRHDGTRWVKITGSRDTAAKTLSTVPGIVPTGQFAVAADLPTGTIMLIR